MDGVAGNDSSDFIVVNKPNGIVSNISNAFTAAFYPLSAINKVKTVILHVVSVAAAACLFLSLQHLSEPWKPLSFYIFH